MRTQSGERTQKPKQQTKSSTNVADTGAKQANKRASNSKETEEREAGPQIQLVMKLLRELHAPTQKAAKAQKIESTEEQQAAPDGSHRGSSRAGSGTRRGGPNERHEPEPRNNSS